MVRHWLVAFLLLVPVAPAPAAAPEQIRIGYLYGPPAEKPLSLVEVPAEDDGRAGAALAIEDNNTTGRFLGQSFSMEEVRIGEGEDVRAAAIRMADQGISFVIADLPPQALLDAADSVRDHDLMFFNVGAPDDRLREQDCRSNIVHVAPTRSMLADGLAQYLVWKQWRKWLLVVGSHPEDRLLGDALRRAARRFGAEIVAERIFEDTGGARQTDSGVVQIQRKIPVLTQEMPEYDVLVAADESEVFAAYLPYRTWDPRPVAGSAGLVPTSWHASHGQWGGLQMQSRFQKRFSRFMTALDMQAWTAVRLIGESAARAGAAEPVAIIDFLTGEELGLGAYKGQKLTIRAWNRQLRQPILLVDGRMVVSVSPQEGFLHQVSELDTLGVDQPETGCSLQ